jgi:hypothetical protein
MQDVSHDLYHGIFMSGSGASAPTVVLQSYLRTVGLVLVFSTLLFYSKLYGQ